MKQDFDPQCSSARGAAGLLIGNDVFEGIRVVSIVVAMPTARARRIVADAGDEEVFFGVTLECKESCENIITMIRKAMEKLG